MKIALTYTDTEEKHNKYVRWLKGMEDIEIIKLSFENDNLEEIKKCDGLVLSGGLDLSPKFYNSDQPDYANAPEKFNDERDAFEINAFQLAQKYNKPVLGICRGMQLVNCALGGNLYQDLDELNKIHRKEQNDKAHVVNILNDSLLNEITKLERSVVNSAHHQAIKELGEGLKINARSDDGIIEGLEWEDPSGKPFLLCIQWHPERMYQLQLQDSVLSKTIRDRFIVEIKKTIVNNENC